MMRKYATKLQINTRKPCRSKDTQSRVGFMKIIGLFNLFDGSKDDHQLTNVCTNKTHPSQAFPVVSPVYALVRYDIP